VIPGLEPQALFVLVVMMATLVAFITEALSIDMVGILVIVALMLGGVLDPAEALEGFGSQALVTIAAMFALSAGLIRAGALDELNRLMYRASRGQKAWLVVLLMLTVAVSSAFVNNTPVAVIFLPVVLGVSGRFGIAPSRLLLPMSYASILGGTCTLIGTSTNLLVSQSAREHGNMAIGMFDFSMPGIVFAVVGFAYLALIGPRLLPTRATVSGAIESGRIREFVTEVYFPPDSPLVDRSFQEVLAKVPGITPLMLIRSGEVIFAPLIANPRAQFVRPRDVLLLKGDPGSIDQLLARDGVSLPPELGELLERQGKGRTVTMVELVVNPNSPLLGRAIARSGFSERHGNAAVIAILRHGEHIRKRVSEVRLRIGDTLLVVCDEKEIETLRSSDAFILLEDVDSKVVRRDRAPIALGIMALVVGLAALDFAPIVTLALTGVAAMVLTGCRSLRHAYSSIDMSIVLLIAGMIALGRALEQTGLVSQGSEALLGLLHDFGPRAVLGGIYVVTALLTCLVSNNAVAVLVTPLAFDTATRLGFDPAPFVFAVLFGASASFATPIGYQTNLFVYAPGGYRFTDYLRLGLPLNIILFVTALYLIPWYWPLRVVTT